MAELAIRNQSARSVRNIIDYIEDDNFQNRNLEQLRIRLLYLEEQWALFANNNNHLIANPEDIDDIAIHQNVFNELEPLYLEAKAILNTRIQELQPVHQNIVQQPQINPVQNQQPIVVHVQGAKQIENTWGEFDGNLTHWQEFHDMFKAAVHDNEQITPAFKFQYLKKSLKGIAADALGNWQLTDNNYVEAWARLKQLYEQKYQTGKELVRKLFNLQKLDRASGAMLQKLSNTTHEVIRQLRALEFPIDQCDFMLVYIIHDKLDAETGKDWEFARRTEIPTINELLTFLDRQAKVLTASQSIEQPKEQTENRKRISVSSESKFSSKRAKFEIPKSKEQCKSCGEAHLLHKCPKFTKMNLQTRKKFVKEKELCRNCLKAGHMMKDCFGRACLRCDVKHNSLLCEENPLNKAVMSLQVKKSGNEKKGNHEQNKTVKSNRPGRKCKNNQKQ